MPGLELSEASKVGREEVVASSSDTVVESPHISWKVFAFAMAVIAIVVMAAALL